jgi:hypothetical protein
LNVPAGHIVQMLLPTAELCVPGEHGTQSIAPVRLLNVPAGHFPQLLLPFVDVFVPSGHALQLMAG